MVQVIRIYIKSIENGSKSEIENDLDVKMALSDLKGTNWSEIQIQTSFVRKCKKLLRNSKSSKKNH